MWILLALLAAVFSAATTLMLKRTVALGGAVASTVGFRAVAGVLLAATTLAMGPLPQLTPKFWRTLAFVVPPEVGGMLCLTLALSTGEVSLVQPIMGLIPLFVMAGGVLFLHEVPSVLAIVGIVLVAGGLYSVGLRKGESAWEPIRALASTRASWYAVTATLFWTVTSLLHKIGIAEVGAMTWATSLTAGSAVALACAIPVVRWKSGSVGVPVRVAPWFRAVALTGVYYAIQQIGLQNAMQRAQAGYVIALSSMSILIATAVGVYLLREQQGVHRVTGALLVSGGVGLIALYG